MTESATYQGPCCTNQQPTILCPQVMKCMQTECENVRLRSQLAAVQAERDQYKADAERWRGLVSIADTTGSFLIVKDYQECWYVWSNPRPVRRQIGFSDSCAADALDAALKAREGRE